MTLVWAVPVVAAAVATLLVVGRARRIEDEVRGLAEEIARLGEVRPRLGAVRAATAEAEAVATAFRDRHLAGTTTQRQGGRTEPTDL